MKKLLAKVQRRTGFWRKFTMYKVALRNRPGLYLTYSAALEAVKG